MLATLPLVEALVSNREEARVGRDAMSPTWDRMTRLSQGTALAATALGGRPRVDNGRGTINTLTTMDQQATTTVRSLRHQSDRTEDQRMLLMVQRQSIHLNITITMMGPCPAQLARKTILPR